MGTRWSGLAVLLTLLGGLLVAGAAEAQEELFVANVGNNSVTVYSRTASGKTAPLRILSGAATGLSGPEGLAVTASSRAVDRDFNGDANADILWRNTSGAVAIWLMNGNSVIGSVVLGTVTTDWTIGGVGDFNGDAKADLLWRNTSGAVSIWLMNGTTIASAVVLGTVTTDWTIERVGDNGDAKADILWRHTSGAVAIWFMNGTAVASTAVLGTVTTDWQIQ